MRPGPGGGASFQGRWLKAGRTRTLACNVHAAASLVLLATTTPSLAEFEIQESTIDKGEIQLQYRGAWHNGLPGPAADQSVEPIIPDDEEAPLVQSHEAEFQMSITSHWLIAMTQGYDEPDDDTLRLNTMEFETQLELITRSGEGLGFAIQGGSEVAVGHARQDRASDAHFGPIVELAKSKFVLVANPMFFKEQGDNAEQEGLGFEYGLQARYEKSPRLWLALEMFGEIDDMANAGPFDEQLHSIGPAFYYTFGADESGEEPEGDIEEKYRELTVSLGAQFGLTEQTSDVALKVFIGYEFN